MYTLLMAVLTCGLPAAAWVLWHKKTGAGLWPLCVGFVAYMLISWMRALARVFVLSDSVREVPWLFYLLSALLSGLFEEAGRYFVFSKAIPNHDRWRDAVTYGIGHISAECILTTHYFDCDLWDCILSTLSFAEGIFFSAALSVLVFAAVHAAGNRRLLWAAVGLHTLADVLGALLLGGIIGVFSEMALQCLFTAGLCYLAWRVYRYYAIPSEVPEHA